MSLHYDHTAGQEYCKMLGMGWDEAFAKRVDTTAHENDITQEQFDVMVREYAWRVKTMWNPRKYTIVQRIMIALFFLNPFAGDK